MLTVCIPLRLVSHFIFAGNSLCNQEIIEGGSDQDEVATININIVPTCFTCLDSMNSPANFPIFRVDGHLIALNDGVYKLQYGLIEL